MPDSDLEKSVDSQSIRARVEYLARWARFMPWISPLGAAFMCGVLWDSISHTRAVIWLVVLTVLAAIRVKIGTSVPVDRLDDPEIVEKWDKYLNWSLFTVCLGLGVGGASVMTGDLAVDSLIFAGAVLKLHAAAGAFLFRGFFGTLTLSALTLPVILRLAMGGLPLKCLAAVLALYVIGNIRVVRAKDGYIRKIHLLSAELASEKGKIERSYTALQRMESLRDSLTHMLVHDLRAPLSSVFFYTQMLDDKKGLDEGFDEAHCVGRIQTLTSGMSTMVDTILDVSRLEADQLPLNCETLDFEELLKTVVERLDPSHSRVSTECPESPTILCDRGLISRVVQNLLMNALRFSPKSEPIVVSVAVRGDSLEMSVLDHGPGVPAVEQERIFDKFAQASKELRSVRSYGLGLTFCKLAVERHGGRIGVESKPGSPTRFFVQLPGAG